MSKCRIRNPGPAAAGGSPAEGSHERARARARWQTRSEPALRPISATPGSELPMNAGLSADCKVVRPDDVANRKIRAQARFMSPK